MRFAIPGISVVAAGAFSLVQAIGLESTRETCLIVAQYKAKPFLSQPLGQIFPKFYLSGILRIF